MAQPMSECPNDMPCINNPLGGDTDINILIGQVINAVLGIVGSLALVMFIYGGFTWMLAAGNNEKVQKGKDILIWATIGLVVIFSAYALVKFVFAGLGVA
ncbi:MAG: pilin [Patescibacteria group bacterium]|nr:pilin [Patescibacteria group bacterium]